MSSTINLPDYVHEQLENIAKSTGFTAYRFEQDAGSKHGDGFLAAMVRISITGQRKVAGGVTEKSDKLDLICKLLPPNKVQRESFCSEFAFAREVDTYNKILPLFVRFQTEKGLTKANGFYEFPHCYYAIADATQNQYVIIMEDMRLTGYTLWNKDEPIEFEKVRLLMTALGRYNGLSLAVLNQRPDLFTTFSSLDDVFLHMAEKSTGFTDLFDSTLSRCVRLFEERPELKVFKTLKTTWKDSFRAAVGGGHLDRFSVVGHGDSWINNFMFKTQENCDEQICILDWQMSRLGSPALDLAHFLFSSTDKAFRDKHLDELLNIYYTQVATTLRACGSDPDQVFTFADLQDQLKRHARFGFVVAPLFVSVVITKPENMSSLESLVEKGESKAKDIANFDAATEALYVERLTDILHDAKAYGWLE